MRVSVLVVLVLGIPALAFAQGPIPEGVEFQVNTYTPWWQEYPVVGFAPSGEFVVVWQDGTNTVAGDDGSRSGVKGQRFDAAGNRLGNEFQVNTYTTNRQYQPAVAVGQDGGFIVVWSGYGMGDTSGQSIQARRYNASGVPLGGEFLVNTITTSGQNHPEVEVGPDGEFVIVWSTFIGAGTDNDALSVSARLFEADGTPDGNEFQVNTVTTLNQIPGTVAKAPDGTFVVVYTSSASMGSDPSNSIQATRFNADGSRIGSEFQVNTYIHNNQRRPKVDVGPEGEFVVVWESEGAPNGQDQDSFSVRGQRFNSAGNQIGGEFQVNTHSTDLQGYPDVAIGAAGDFVVTWTGVGPGPDPYGSVIAQGFNNQGLPVGSEFQVNTIETYDESQARVASHPAGRFVVVWRGYDSFGNDDSRYSIQARRYSFPPGLIFANTFGSRDTSKWSASVP